MTVGVSGRPLRVRGVYILATLRHFDINLGVAVKKGPLIPWQRRLAILEISEFQEVTFRARFENREYDRPFGHFLVTLRGFN